MKQIDDITWQSNDGLITFKNMDCNEFMAGCKDKEFDLIHNDPPYGINLDGGQLGYSKHEKKDWDSESPDIKHFDLCILKSINQIFWGFNHYLDKVTSTKAIIVWNKHQNGYFAQCELAWCSVGTVKLYDRAYQKDIGDKIHPTQKPIELYCWILDNYTKPTDTILDCFGGSMSHAIAAHMKRRKLTIIELDKDYFDMALFRFSEYEQKVEDIKEFGYAKTKLEAQNPVLF